MKETLRNFIIKKFKYQKGTKYSIGISIIYFMLLEKKWTEVYNVLVEFSKLYLKSKETNTQRYSTIFQLKTSFDIVYHMYRVLEAGRQNHIAQFSEV